VSCWRYRSFYSVLDALTTDLHVLRAEEQRTAARLRRLEKHLGADPCIIILDDLDVPAVREREDMLYSLAAIGKVGLICISASEKAVLELSQRVRARLNPRVIVLKLYSSGEIAEILLERAQLALAPGSWTEGVLARIAELSSGSATIAIEILRASAYAAEVQHDRKIRPCHIREGRSTSLAACERSLTAGLTPHHVLLWKLVRKEGKIPSGKLRRTYVARCRAHKVAPIATRTYSKYVSHLTRIGMIQPVGHDHGSRVFQASMAALPQCP
jgi:Cdc6-like AAA superfamily ATPase